MVFKLIYASEVYQDLQQNIDWYNKRQTGLGTKFFKAVKTQVSRIRENPSSIAIRYKNVRCAKVKGFPYMVHFKIFPEANTIKIIAVFCTHRDPNIWEKRDL